MLSYQFSVSPGYQGSDWPHKRSRLLVSAREASTSLLPIKNNINIYILYFSKTKKKEDIYLAI